MKLLNQIDSPADLRRLRPEQLQPVADEVRQYILETMSRVGGHTGASLGAVELAVGLAARSEQLPQFLALRLRGLTRGLTL